MKFLFLEGKVVNHVQEIDTYAFWTTLYVPNILRVKLSILLLHVEFLKHVFLSSPFRHI